MIGLLAVPIAVADTGPEYLEFETNQDPLSAAFLRYKLPFVEERHNTLHLRSYYMDRSIDKLKDRQDLAGGGWLTVVSDYWEDRIKLGGSVFTSQKLYADSDKADTGLLQRDHEGYSGLGEIYGIFNIDKLALQAGRYALNLPYINMADTRMIPQTFQGAHGLYRFNEDWSVVAGVLTDIKRRTSTQFKSLYEAAGLDGEETLSGFGSIYQSADGSLAGLYFFHAPDYINNTYIELSKSFNLGESRHIQVSAQYTRQDSVGAELDGDFTVEHYGARVSWQLPAFSISAAYTDYPEEDRLRRPWGSVPGYTSVMVKDFIRPQESAWLVGSTLHFDRWGWPGLQVNGKFIKGDTPDCGKSASPDQDEIDLTVQYKPQAEKLRGLSLRLRGAWIDQQDSCLGGDAKDIVDFRLIVNYEFTL